tara:strand:+ start:45818 stop:45943 length:126 start_codon:yes stop_codon:yes gene_type:complete
MLHFFGNQPQPFLVGLPSANAEFRVSVNSRLQEWAKDENYD